jgi:signal transduction histidine kinase
VSQVLASAPTLEAAAPRILEAIGRGLDWDVGVWWAPEGEGLRSRQIWHDPGFALGRFLEATRERTFAPDVGLPGRVFASGEPHWISDVVWDRNFPRGPVAAAVGLHAGFAFPIRLGAEVLGVIEFFSREVRQPDPGALQTFAAVGVEIGVFLDRRQTEEERARLLVSLREASRAKDDFLAVLGHELRNPLAPLRSALEVLRARGWPDAVAERMGDVMDRQLRHMVRLVDDLLDVSRITRGRVELRKETVDLGEVVARAVEATRPLLDERRHALSVDVGAAPLLLHGDPTRLEQVVANLLHNAARYTDSGGRITVRAAAQDGQAVLRVEDSGIGLRPEMIERIFEPFVQGERPSSSRPAPGLGIGLTLVRRLVEMHQGSVTASSAGPGQGSVFTVRLPLAAADAATAAVAPARARVRVPASVRRRVLVVDDNVDGADSLALVLQQAGHEAVVVYDGRAALAEAAQSAFDVVLLDLGLPEGLDGYEVARRLRAAAPGAVPVLVALTGFGQEEDQRRTRAAGFARHLVKPVDPEELQRVIQNL